MYYTKIPLNWPNVLIFIIIQDSVILDVHFQNTKRTHLVYVQVYLLIKQINEIDFNVILIQNKNSKKHYYKKNY